MKWPLWEKGNHLGGYWTFTYCCYSISSLALSPGNSCRALFITFCKQQDKSPTVTITLPVQDSVPSSPTRQEKDQLKAIFGQRHLLDELPSKPEHRFQRNTVRTADNSYVVFCKEPKLLQELRQCHLKFLGVGLPWWCSG